MNNLVILGASGSIGSQSIEVIKKDFKNKFDLIGVSIGQNILFFKNNIYPFFKIKYLYVDKDEDKNALKKEYKKIKIFSSKDGILTFLNEVNKECDTYLNALSGYFGLKPTLFILNNNKKLLLANKESLVIGGEIIKKIKNSAQLIFPIDSEHAAIRKCLANVKKKELENIYITCSGGPFFNLEKEKFKDIKSIDCLKHPTYSMGKKISIDSSTLINKAFEIIEAYYLFKVKEDIIKVKINRDSYVHSYIKLKNGTYKLSVGKPDMKVQIKDALSFFKYKKNEEFIDTEINTLNKYKFYEVDKERFPLIDYGYKVIKYKGISGLVLNDVVEICDKFLLEDKIKYIDINRIIDKIFSLFDLKMNLTLTNIDSIHEDIINKTLKIIEKKEY